MEKETVTAWFSYASPQQPQVVELCDWLKADKVEAIAQAAIAQLSNESEKQLAHIRLLPKRYRLDEDDTSTGSTPVYRLAPGKSINELVFDIANNPLRIMVLSKAYFKSQVCLKELCLSLCANHNTATDNRLPMVILAGFEDDSKVLSDGKFTFAAPAQTEDITASDTFEKQTLAEALAATHKVLSAELSGWRGFDLSAEFCQQLPQILKTLSKKVYALLADNSNSVAIDIYRYGFSYLSKIDSLAHQRAVEHLYNEWYKSELAQELNKKLDWPFAQIRSDNDEAQRYLDSVYEILENEPSLCRRAGAQEMVLRLYGLVILKCLKPVGANLLAVLNKNTLISVNVDDDKACGFENAIHATLSYCANRGFIPLVNHQVAGGQTDRDCVSGVVFPRRATINGAGETEVLYAFQELLQCLAPFAARPRDEQQLYDKTFIRKIRAGLKRIRRNKYALLVLSLSMHRDKNGYYSILEKMEEIINQDYPDENLSIPCVILRAETTPENEMRSTLLFSQDAFDQFEIQFQDMTELFRSNVKNNKQ